MDGKRRGGEWEGIWEGEREGERGEEREGRGGRKRRRGEGREGKGGTPKGWFTPTMFEILKKYPGQPAGDVSHKPGSRLPLLSAEPAVTLATLKRAATNFAAWRTQA